MKLTLELELGLDEVRVLRMLLTGGITEERQPPGQTAPPTIAEQHEPADAPEVAPDQAPSSRPARPTKATCAHCGKAFRVGRLGIIPRYCDGKCRSLARYHSDPERFKAKRQERRARRRQAAPAPPSVTGEATATSPVEVVIVAPKELASEAPRRSCRHCGKALPADARPEKLYCDHHCANAAYYEAHRKTGAENGRARRSGVEDLVGTRRIPDEVVGVVGRILGAKRGGAE